MFTDNYYLGGGTPRTPKGGQRYSLIGGGSYGC